MSLPAAYDRYWAARNYAEQQAAVYEILLKGGRDGYPNTAVGEWRRSIARGLRWLAWKMDQFE